MIYKLNKIFQKKIIKKKEVLKLLNFNRKGTEIRK
jgi:hypothetical protein